MGGLKNVITNVKMGWVLWGAIAPVTTPPPIDPPLIKITVIN